MHRGDGSTDLSSRGAAKLYIYGYLNQVQSSRRLKRKAGRKRRGDVADRAYSFPITTITDFRKTTAAPSQICTRFDRVVSRSACCLPQRRDRQQRVRGQRPRPGNSRAPRWRGAAPRSRRATLRATCSRARRRQPASSPQGARDQTAGCGRDREAQDTIERLAVVRGAVLESPDQQVSLTDPTRARWRRAARLRHHRLQRAGRGRGRAPSDRPHQVTNVGSDRSQLAHMAKASKAFPGGAARCRRRSPATSQRRDAALRRRDRGDAAKPMTSGARPRPAFGEQSFVTGGETSIAARPAKTLKYHSAECSAIAAGRFALDEGFGRLSRSERRCQTFCCCACSA